MPILAVCKCLEVARRVSLLHGVYGTSDPDAQKLAARVEKENAYKAHKEMAPKGYSLRDRHTSRKPFDACFQCICGCLDLFRRRMLRMLH